MSLASTPTMIIQVAEHNQTADTEVRMIQVALIHRTVAHAAARILAVHDEIDQPLLAEVNVLCQSVYRNQSILIIIMEDNDHHE